MSGVVQPGTLEALQAGTSIPPSFDQNPWAYGFALFGLIVLTSLTAAGMVRVARCIDPHRDGYGSPITLDRLRKLALGMTLLTLALPDVIILLAWGEISDAAMMNLWVLDRFLDGMTILPFLVACGISIRGGERIDTALVMAPNRSDMWPTWRQTRDHISIIVLVAIIAAGVALGKV